MPELAGVLIILILALVVYVMVEREQQYRK